VFATSGIETPHSFEGGYRSAEALPHPKSESFRSLLGIEESPINRVARDVYSLARSRLITSSEVITPVNLLWSSITGRVSRLYLSNSSANSFSPAPARHEISGSWVRESNGVSGEARTSLAKGTAPASVPCESIR